jgi:ribosomal protein S12 methylthiotransferase accessory factor
MPHLPAMGITRIADVTGLDYIGIPVCMAVMPNSRSVSVSQGKGVTLELAKASAAMESIETYHAENIDLPVIRASYNELRAQKQTVADPSRLLFSQPDIYHPGLELFWIKGIELINEQEIWVPHDAVSIDFVRPTEGGFLKNSNGLASGNHLMEALSHAICEVVERDAIVHFHLGFNNNAMPVNLQSVDSAACQHVFSLIHDAGLIIIVLNITHEIGIPTFICYLIDPSPANQSSQSKVNIGYGTHLSREIALLRAVTEAVQSRLTIIAGSRDDIKKAYYLLAEFRSYQKNSLIKKYSEQPEQDFATIPSLETESLDQDVQLELDLLKSNGIDQVLMVNLTKEAFEIPVVHVLIPGMEFNMEEDLKHNANERAANAKVKQIMEQLDNMLQ